MPALSAPFKAAGTTLGYKLTSGATTYVNLGLLITLDPGNTDVEEIDTTTLASTVMSNIPAIPDNGEVSFKTFNVPSNASIVELEALAASPAVIYWQVQLPDGASSTTGTTYAFTAWLKSLKRSSLDVKSAPQLEVTLRVTGAVTIGAAT